MEHDIEHDYRRWINSLRHDQPELGSRISAICFVDDLRFFEVQAADMIAGLIRQELERRIANRPDSEINPLYTWVMEGSDAQIQLIDPSEF